jgi:hypothetical protein
MRILGIVAPDAAWRGCVIGGAVLLLSACAQQQQALWLKPGAASDDFSQDKYGCMQQSQQPSSAAYVNRYGGVANSNIITNGGLYDACMNSKGWVLTPVTDVKGFTEAMRPMGEEIRAACSRDDLQVLFRKKMACKAVEANPEQTSDRSKITNEEKTALTKWLEVIQAANEKVAAVYRQYDSKNGNTVADSIEAGSSETKKLALEFLNGSLSWGEYNRRRAELAKRLLENQKNALMY